MWELLSPFPTISTTLGIALAVFAVGLVPWWVISLVRAPTNYKTKNWYEESRKTYFEYVRDMSLGMLKGWLYAFPLYFILALLIQL